MPLRLRRVPVVPVVVMAIPLVEPIPLIVVGGLVAVLVLLMTAVVKVPLLLRMLRVLGVSVARTWIIQSGQRDSRWLIAGDHGMSENMRMVIRKI